MANAIIGAVSVSVAREGGVDHEYEEWGGGRKRMDDGSLRVTKKGDKSVWRLKNATPLVAATADALIVAINTAPPITCSGDALGGSFSCAGRVLKRQPVTVRGTVKYYVSWILWEI